jgi:hypothetical protein
MVAERVVALTLQKGPRGTTTPDYKRNGTTTLLDALNMLEGMIGRCMQCRWH